MQAHTGAKLLSWLLYASLQSHKGPLQALRCVDPLIDLVVGYVICFHVCCNYVIIT